MASSKDRRYLFKRYNFLKYLRKLYLQILIPLLTTGNKAILGIAGARAHGEKNHIYVFFLQGNKIYVLTIFLYPQITFLSKFFLAVLKRIYVYREEIIIIQ